MSVPDARDVAKSLRRNGWDVAEHTDAHGAPRWTATHPTTETPITWGPNVNKRATLRRAGDAIGDKVLAGRNMRAVNKTKQADRAMRSDVERAALLHRREQTTRPDVIARRRIEGPRPLDDRHAAAVAAIGYTIEPHALERIRERDVDPGNLCRCLARPEAVRTLNNGHVLYSTPTCKVYVDPQARRILTVV